MIRIGFITDLSGPYAQLDGSAGGEAIRMAVADLGGMVAGKRIEVEVADHQNQTNVAVARARELLDGQRIDVLIGGVNSGPSLAMAKLAGERRRPYIAVGAGNSAHTQEQCSPYTVQYAYDTTAQGRALGLGLIRAGAKSWFFITPDYAFGVQMQDAAANAVQAEGGTVRGSVRHAYGAIDFTAALRQAQDSGAEVLGFASGHADGINLVNAAKAQGIGRTMKLAGTFLFIDEIHELGLSAAQGVYVTDSWFWTRDADSRLWSRRFFDRFKRMPSSLHAADYSAATQYLKAVEAAGTDDPDTVLAQLRSTKLDDTYVKGGRIRPDGVMVHDMHLLRIKAPAASTEPWDFYEHVDTIIGDAAWTPRSEARCGMWK
ncbi:ABC transporter substrate-binding protein [uncultured Enterovirga sp.]|uniref:ABC transporter substrate-binding protein n=1 Tax=uncultured Enterovirga sp. TaxID=2026352 RepID=UPI0035CA2CED